MALPAKVPKKTALTISTPSERASRNRPVPTAEDWAPLMALSKEAIEKLRDIIKNSDSEKNQLDAAKFVVGMIFPQPKALELDIPSGRSPEETRLLRLSMVKALGIGKDQKALSAIGLSVEEYGTKDETGS